MIWLKQLIDVCLVVDYYQYHNSICGAEKPKTLNEFVIWLKQSIIVCLAIAANIAIGFMV